jgi:hypothetical protein
MSSLILIRANSSAFWQPLDTEFKNTMQSADTFTQLTFHYQSGETESFDIPGTPEAFQMQLQGLLNQDWLTLHLLIARLSFILPKL